jgi:hypothetical protein
MKWRASDEFLDVIQECIENTPYTSNTIDGRQFEFTGEKIRPCLVYSFCRVRWYERIDEIEEAMHRKCA